MTTSTPEPRLAVEIAQLWPPQGQWTEHDYLGLPDTNQIVELSEGEIFIIPPPSLEHQLILDNIYSLLKAFVKAHNLGITTFSPIAVRLWVGKIREPDIVFYNHVHADRADGTISGIPDLVMEAVLPGSRTVDRREKFQEYAQAGIAEYWIVDPKPQTVEVFILDTAGAYTLFSKAEVGAAASSKLLNGFSANTEAVFG